MALRTILAGVQYSVAFGKAGVGWPSFLVFRGITNGTGAKGTKAECHDAALGGILKKNGFRSLGCTGP
jgi:hypothetical protein